MTRSRSDEEDGPLGAEAEKMRLQMNEEKLMVVSKEVKIENIKNVGTGRSKEMQTEKRNEAERGMKEKDIVDKTSTGYCAAEPKAGPDRGKWKSAMKKNCFVLHTSVTDLEDESEFETGSVLTAKVSLVLTDPPYNNRNARDQSDCAHEVLSKKDVEYEMRLMGNVMARGAHGHISCADLMSHH